MKRIGVVGASGRTGGRVVEVLRSHPRCELGAAVVSSRSAVLGAAVVGSVVYVSDLAVVAECDGVIDFSTAERSVEVAAACAAHGRPLVVATTGHSAEQVGRIEECGTRIPVCLAPNTSIGATVLALAAEYVQRLVGPSFDIEVLDIHHRMKRDAPSGTARMVVQGLVGAEPGSVNPQSRVVYGRQGVRRAGEVGVAALRGGDVVGDHTIFFLGDSERLEVTHRCSSRDVFARGAVELIERLLGRPAGVCRARELLVAA